jgi:ribose transport system substrate-binding protein
MIHQFSRRSLLQAGLAMGIAGVAAGCSTAGSGGSGGSASASGANHMVAPVDGKLVVGLANGWAGNSWRSQMVAEFKYAAENKFAADISRTIITDANQSVDQQISQINDMITAGANLILIDAASATALSGVVQRAQEAGIQVVSFDNAVESEYNIIINTSAAEFGQIGGEWLAGVLSSGDEVFMLDGVSGTPNDSGRAGAARTALEAKGIKIVANAAGDWDQAKAQAAAANLLSANPNVKGIYSQGGAMSLGAIEVLEQRGLDVLPIPGEGYNGFLKKWKELRDATGWESIAPSQSPALSVTALQYGINALRGEDPGQTVDVKLDVIDKDNLDENVRPDMSDAMFLPTSLPDDILHDLFG